MAVRTCTGLTTVCILVLGVPVGALAQAPAPAPGPGSGVGCYTALNVLEASGQYNTLLTLLDSTNLTVLLDNPAHFVTVLAPTDAGIASTLKGLNGTIAGLESSTAVQPILQYHILPSPVMFSAFQNDNSFNTILYQGSNVQTISINRTMDHVSVEGAFSIANITNTGTDACGAFFKTGQKTLCLKDCSPSRLYLVGNHGVLIGWASGTLNLAQLLILVMMMQDLRKL